MNLPNIPTKLFPLSFYINEYDAAQGKPVEKKHMFLVSPETLKIQKKAEISQTRTLGGNVVQPWFNHLDKLSLGGMLFGFRSLADMYNIKAAIGAPAAYKEMAIGYKLNRYRCFMESVSIDAKADAPRQFTYSLEIIMLDPLNLPSLFLGQTPPVSAEITAVSGRVTSATDGLLNMKKDLFSVGGKGISSVKSVGSAVKNLVSLKR